MPKNTTTYRFRLPDGQVHGGASPERIFAVHPDAVITHETTWGADGREIETVRLEPLLRRPEASADWAYADRAAVDSGIVFDPNGDLLVATDDRVQRFDMDGLFVGEEVCEDENGE